jgi:hypothetical protein
MLNFAGMRKNIAIDFFGSPAALASALGISRQSVHGWKELVPEGKASRLERMTGGRLKYDPTVYLLHTHRRSPSPKSVSSAAILRRSSKPDKGANTLLLRDKSDTTLRSGQ